ncbi:MAG: N-acetylmuramoyl-L-alanine amidase [Parvularculaceae bacterium]|nr:N-acetylmuramoyl-L-alanine amidase [Parvularculaceae bacterium]
MKKVKIVERPSPNFDDRGRPVDMIVLHYTGMLSGAEALGRLTDAGSKVSCHYLVEEDGTIYVLVPEGKRAWHAGVSFWRGDTETNARSIGIEIVNPGHEWGYRKFPSRQIDMVVALVKDIRARHNVPIANVVGHSDVAPQRKEDPGELFPWKRLAEEGLAIGPYEGDPDPSISYEDALSMLRAIGYDAPDKAHAAALVAFQRRFCPEALAQGFSPLTKAALKWVAALTA